MVGVGVQRVVQVNTEGGSVGEVGQRIMKGLVGQLLLQALALADITRVEDQALHRRQPEQIGHGHLDRAVGVVFPAKPAFDRDRRTDDVDRLVDLAQHLGAIVRVDELAERGSDQLRVVEAEDAFH